MATSARLAEGERTFEVGLLPRIAAIPFFRLATDEEVGSSYDAYRAGDFDRLCDVWCEHAQPTRADLGSLTKYYDRARWAPSRANGLAFLATVRAVLRAGEKFRARLSARTQEVLAREFPWLEQRHRHIPDGWTPRFRFPDEFRLFIDALSVDDARVRWQLCAALNEVQQHWYSRHAAERFGVPELVAHAARERQLAVSYFSHWAPNATRELWRQCICMLDALNAATFDLLCNQERFAMVRHAVTGMVTRGA
ncbi:MAG: hypothetical protein JWM53_6132, partial [bacterium]|nr:hypothetical protein [bacterium]